MAKKMAKSMVGKSMVEADGAQPSVQGRGVSEAVSRPRHPATVVSIVRATGQMSGGRALELLQRLDQGRQHLVHVPHDAEVGDRENRRVLVLVDLDDVLGP